MIKHKQVMFDHNSLFSNMLRVTQSEKEPIEKNVSS